MRCVSETKCRKGTGLCIVTSKLIYCNPSYVCTYCNRNVEWDFKKKQNKQTKNQHITRAHLPGHCEHSVCCLEERTSLSLPGLHRRKWGEMLCAQGHVIPHRETHIYPVMLSVLVCAYTHTNTLFQQTGYWQGATVWNFAMSIGFLPCPSWVLYWRSQTCTYASRRIMLFSPADNIIKVIFDIMSESCCFFVFVLFFSFFVPFLVRNLTMLS